MKDNIFAELYNKLLGFFRQAEEEESSKDVARNRLRVVLMQDRTNLTPQLLEKMRSELIELLSKYLEMDKEALELNLEQEGEQMALMLSIPVIRAKDETEIEKALEENEQTETSEEETSEDKPTSEEETSEKNEDEKVSTEDILEEDVESEHPENQTKNFPNKETCGDCKECELSDDIECEKKEQNKSTKKTK